MLELGNYMGNTDEHEMHMHPDLVVREQHLNELIATLKANRMRPVEDGRYQLGYTSYAANSIFAAKDNGFSRA